MTSLARRTNVLATMAIEDREFHKTAPLFASGRPSMYECREPAFDLGTFLDQHLPAVRDARVLDAGCGGGAYVAATSERAAELVVLDIAAGRLRNIDPRSARRVCADVADAPFGDATFDVVMAMHMLYHVPDIGAAVGELRRILRPGGTCYALTNSERAQPELDRLIRRNGGDPARSGDFAGLRFSNENGAAQLAAGFDDIVLVDFPGSQLVVRDPEQIVDELVRNRYVHEPGLRPGVGWTAFLDDVRQDARNVIEREGAFRISEHHGLFACR